RNARGSNARSPSTGSSSPRLSMPDERMTDAELAEKLRWMADYLTEKLGWLAGDPRPADLHLAAQRLEARGQSLPPANTRATEAKIEVMPGTAYHMSCAEADDGERHIPSWFQVSEMTRDFYRRTMRAALTAVAEIRRQA